MATKQPKINLAHTNLYYYKKFKDSVAVYKAHSVNSELYTTALGTHVQSVHHFYVSAKGHIDGMYTYKHYNFETLTNDDTVFLSARGVLDAVYKVIEDTWGHKSATQFWKEVPSIYDKEEDDNLCHL